MAGLNDRTDGQQTSAAEILGHAAMMPFLTPRRLVTVYGYLSHLDKRMAASKDTGNGACRSRFAAGVCLMRRSLARPGLCGQRCG